MNKKNSNTTIIDWTDRKDAMATYRKFEELGMTGPTYQYYNGKLLPADEPMMLRPDPVPYQLKSEAEENQC